MLRSYYGSIGEPNVFLGFHMISTVPSSLVSFRPE
jgi:hypothetical protein